AWSEYRAASYALIEDAALLRQGEHALSVRSRPVGSTRFGSLGRECFVVDVTPPMVELAHDRASFWAVDTVEEQSSLQYRTLSADGGWSAWRVVGRAQVTLDAPVDGLEVRDS